VLVSDQMLHGVRRLAEKKPVVACFGDVAASGGYLAAMGASAIFAEATTITGSIGVVAARFGIAPLLEKVGIVVETVQRGRRADMHSPSRRLAPDEREALEGELAEVYRYFVEAVARGRARPPSEIEALAEGRIYSGVEALRLGLVDGLGGFPEALLELRRRLAGRAERWEPEVVSPRWQPDALAASWPLRLATGGWGDAAVLALAASRDRVWLWCPSRVVELGAPDG
jgi:protease-4